jgi:hypothetical protein
MSKELSARRFEEELLRFDFVGLFEFEIPNYISNILVEFPPKIFEIVVLEIAKASQKNKHAGRQKGSYSQFSNLDPLLHASMRKWVQIADFQNRYILSESELLISNKRDTLHAGIRKWV